MTRTGFDNGKEQFVSYHTRHMDPDLLRRLHIYAILQGVTVERALLTALHVGLHCLANGECLTKVNASVSEMNASVSEMNGLVKT